MLGQPCEFYLPAASAILYVDLAKTIGDDVILRFEAALRRATAARRAVPTCVTAWRQSAPISRSVAAPAIFRPLVVQQSLHLRT
jgi:hypothetical protein